MVDSAEITPISAMTLGVKINFSCEVCDEVEVAIANTPSGEITASTLNTIHSSSVEPIEGKTVSSGGFVTYKLSDLSMTLDDIENRPNLFSKT